ncbi:MAG TPA: hypothetical protein VGK73_31695 [Polyangiaceae bacterium]
MTGLSLAIVEGAALRSPYAAITVGSEPIVIVECVVGEDPDEKDPEDDEDVPEAA